MTVSTDSDPAFSSRDTDLIERCARYVALADRFDRLFDGSGPIDEETDQAACALTAELDALAGAIEGLEASTLAGMRAKARVALHFRGEDDIPSVAVSLARDVAAIATGRQSLGSTSECM